MLQKPIDYVFIDTSVFKRESYFKNTGLVSRLFELAANGWIRVLMPEIAKKEWSKHYKEAMHLKFEELDRKATLMGNTEEVCDFVNKHKVLTAAYETIVEKSC